MSGFFWLISRKLFALFDCTGRHVACLLYSTRKGCHISRAACETLASGDLNAFAEFTYDPKAMITTADSIGTYLFGMLVVIR
ncbi:MAG TPA: hypothetical protein DEA75_09160 [Rhodobacteraceae bacterium]|nr:hypothetical protein [Paracoccaceae bacterium]